jgi:hypothetical protein
MVVAAVAGASAMTLLSWISSKVTLLMYFPFLVFVRRQRGMAVS